MKLNTKKLSIIQLNHNYKELPLLLLLLGVHVVELVTVATCS